MADLEHDPKEMRFRAEGGRKASTAARAYLYGVVASMLEAEYATSPANREGWVFGGIENDFDRRRLLKELKKLEAEMLRRARKLRAP